MTMTNYMELLAVNSPWNLILFMVIPVVAAESLVAAEFYALFYGEEKMPDGESLKRLLEFLQVYISRALSCICSLW